MIVACIVVGIFLSIIGLYIKSELKEDGTAISVGGIALFAVIAFIVGILIATERIWALIFLFPYLMIRFYTNKKQQGEMSTKVTWCEFCMGTGIGLGFILVVIVLLVYYMFNNRGK